MRRRYGRFGRKGRLGGALLLAVAAGCTPPAGDGVGREEFIGALRGLEERLTPGLHSLMTQVQHRHANLWFAGEAGNWPLADYMLHELEELLAEIEELHPEYLGFPVAALLREMTLPAMEALEETVANGDREAFALAYDNLTSACNHCHVAAERAAIVIQRPTHPPLTNLRFAPGGE